MFIAMKQSGAITVSNTAVKLLSQLGLSDSQLNELAGCDISVQDMDILIRYDGAGDLTAAGMLLKNGALARLTTRTDVLNCLMIRATGADAKVIATALKGV